MSGRKGTGLTGGCSGPVLGGADGDHEPRTVDTDPSTPQLKERPPFRSASSRQCQKGRTQKLTGGCGGPVFGGADGDHESHERGAHEGHQKNDEQEDEEVGAAVGGGQAGEEVDEGGEEHDLGGGRHTCLVTSSGLTKGWSYGEKSSRKIKKSRLMRPW